MKKILKCLLIFLLLINYRPILAEVDFENNEDYYRRLCSSNNISSENKDICNNYSAYIANKRKELKDSYDQIQKQIEEIENDITKTGEIIKGIQEEINTIQQELNLLNIEIGKLEASIKTLEENILNNEKEVNKISSKVLGRMQALQKVMHFNPFLDFILGSKDLEDLIIRTNGINTVMRSDKDDNDRLKSLIEKLNNDKLKLEKDKINLDKQKESFEIKQEELTLRRTSYENIRIEYQRKEAELREAGNQIANDLENTRNIIRELGDSLDHITSSDGWLSPLPISAYFRSAGTWEYPDGGLHLGMDFAAPIGTTIVAPGNGIVIHSYDGCDTWGYLGSTCGSVWGLGNQIRMVTLINGNLYGIVMGHMKQGSPISSPTVVEAGDYVGLVGSSGSSTGPHMHMEIMYLGSEAEWRSADNSAINNYVDSWDGNLAFGAGWRTLSTTCDNNGFTAPCRMRPESIYLGE